MTSAATDRVRQDLPLAARLEWLSSLAIRRFEVTLSPTADPPALGPGWLKDRGLSIAAVSIAGQSFPGLGEPDEERRQQGVRHARIAGRWALARRTPWVIVEPGSLALVDARRREDEAWRLAARGDAGAAAAVLPLRETRDELAQRQLPSLCRSLHELARAEPDVRWCLPTPGGPTAFPSRTELEWVFEDLAGRGLAYWHRSALAERNRRLGGEDPEAWLDAFGPRIAGAHLDDLGGEDVGLLPGTGELDLRPVAAALPVSAERVLALPADAGPVAIQAGLRYLASIGID